VAEPRIVVGAAPLDVGAETAKLLACAGDAVGGVGSFLGVVRGAGIAALELEHYPGMTERALREVADAAVARFALLACTVIHRVGRLAPGEPIVLVLAAAPHRRAALDATAFLIDWLKTRAPFWKREHLAGGGERWVDAREADEAAAAAWDQPAGAGTLGS
jgi:molybdopterin synthase catalytic subunit